MLALGLGVTIGSPAVTLTLLDDAAIRATMPGIVDTSFTLHLSTQAPIPGGLFCTDVFGPLKTPERATRMGHIVLPVPVLHPWAFDAAREALDIEASLLERVLDGDRTLDDAAPGSWQETGSAAVCAALRARGAGHLVFSVWPVLPPDLRVLLPLDGGRYATSALNDLYRAVIDAVDAIGFLMSGGGRDDALRVQCAILQSAVEDLVESGLRRPAGTEALGLSAFLQGPEGAGETDPVSDWRSQLIVGRLVLT